MVARLRQVQTREALLKYLHLEIGLRLSHRVLGSADYLYQISHYLSPCQEKRKSHLIESLHHHPQENIGIGSEKCYIGKGKALENYNEHLRENIVIENIANSVKWNENIGIVKEVNGNLIEHLKSETAEILMLTISHANFMKVNKLFKPCNKFNAKQRKLPWQLQFKFKLSKHIEKVVVVVVEVDLKGILQR